jgi:branched-chain amino acid transport system permease protein
MKLPLRHPGLLVLALILALLPLVLPNAFYFDVAIRIALNAIVVIGLNLLMGYTGQISLGHAGFYGLGAYASAALTTHYNWPPLAALLAGAVATGLLALLLARPVLKLKGHTLAMATLGLGIIIAIVINNESQWTGGPDGIGVSAFTLLGMEIAGEKTWYAVCAALLLLVTWLALNLIDSPVGRALQAIHGSEVASRVVGIDTTRFKVRVFVLSAVVASVAGSISAHYIGFITPGMAGFFHSIELVTMVVVGGLASVFGAIVGAALLTVLPQLLSAFEGWEVVVFGVILMATMIFMPRGLVPSLARRRAARPSTAARPHTAAGPHADAALRFTAAGAQSSPMLSVQGLDKRFGGVHAVREVSFEVRAGAIHSVIGPNGAGKTTLFNLITGVYAPSAGRIMLCGEDVAGLSPDALARRGMSRTFQNLQVCMNMTALDNVMVGSHLRLSHSLFGSMLRLPSLRRADAVCRAEAAALMDFVGVGAYIDADASQMPYGALKRLEIARALAAQPKILLLDEPAAGLNHTETAEIEALIRKVAQAGVTVVLVEHDMKLVMNLSDHILVLDYGKKLAEGSAAEVRANPDVIAAYLGVAA